MKGVLFNVAEDVVTEVMSADAWDDVLDAAGLAGGYTSLGNYDDADLGLIVQHVADAASLSVEDTLRLVGTKGFAHLAARHEELLTEFADWRAVLSGLDGIIHPEVEKIYPGSTVPRFAVQPHPDDPAALQVEYRSERALGALAEGLILGLGTWFGVELHVVEEPTEHATPVTSVLRVTEVT